MHAEVILLFFSTKTDLISASLRGPGRVPGNGKMRYSKANLRNIYCH